MQPRRLLRRLLRDLLQEDTLWLCFFVVMQVMDVATTALALRAGSQEMNPIASGLLQHGEVAMYTSKAVMVLFVVLMVTFLGRRLKSLWMVPRVGALLYAFIFVWNLVSFADSSFFGG